MLRTQRFPRPRKLFADRFDTAIVQPFGIRSIVVISGERQELPMVWRSRRAAWVDQKAETGSSSCFS